MERMILCFAAALVIWGAVSLFASPIKLGLKLIASFLFSFAALWVFNQLGVHMGLSLGVNGINAAILALFGPAGLVMLLFLRWMGL